MEGKSSPSFPYFPRFRADPERRESLRPAFPISLHLVQIRNVRKVKQNYYKQAFQKCHHDIKKTWKLVNEIIAIKKIPTKIF